MYFRYLIVVLPEQYPIMKRSFADTESGSGSPTGYRNEIGHGSGIPRGIPFTIPVKHYKTCATDECRKGASYGPPGKTPTHCVSHMPTGYVVKNTSCLFQGCTRQPSFGPRGAKRYTHCSEHGKPLGYEDLKNKRCLHPGCTKNRSFGIPGFSRRWCDKHKMEGSINLVETICMERGCERQGQNGTRRCVKHGGGRACAMACCYRGGPYPHNKHPEFHDPSSEYHKKWVCAFASRAMIENLLMEGEMDRANDLRAHFKMKSLLVLNAQSAFRIECEKHYCDLLKRCTRVVFDNTITTERKTLGDKRPDIFYQWSVNGKNFAVHIEYDEWPRHEDDESRLRWISVASGCEGRVYLIRVIGGHGTSRAACVMKKRGDINFYAVSPTGSRLARNVAKEVKKRIAWITDDLCPDTENGRPAKIILRIDQVCVYFCNFYFFTCTPGP